MSNFFYNFDRLIIEYQNWFGSFRVYPTHTHNRYLYDSIDCIGIVDFLI